MTIVTDIIAIIVAAMALIMSFHFSRLQQNHNRNSVRPIAEIVLYDYENLIAVKIKNNGTGPMIIRKVITTRMTEYDKTEVADNLLALMPRIDQKWSGYTTELNDRSLSDKDSITLLSLRPANDDIKLLVRNALKDVYIDVIYEDIYGEQFQTRRTCEFFGRSL